LEIKKEFVPLQSQIGKRADLAKANLDKLFFLEKQKVKKL
jgi:hypothetical protein